MREAVWNGGNVGLIFAFTLSMFCLYTVAPLLYRMASSAYFNLSVLTSDFYGLLFGLFLFVGAFLLPVISTMKSSAALSSVLALLCGFRSCSGGTDHLLLARNS